MQSAQTVQPTIYGTITMREINYYKHNRNAARGLATVITPKQEGMLTAALRAAAVDFNQICLDLFGCPFRVLNRSKFDLFLKVVESKAADAQAAATTADLIELDQFELYKASQRAVAQNYFADVEVLGTDLHTGLTAYAILSKSGASYTVETDGHLVKCDCPDFKNRGRVCKHALAVVTYRHEDARAEAQRAQLTEADAPAPCELCGNYCPFA